jgi:hypothetical protein
VAQSCSHARPEARVNDDGAREAARPYFGSEEIVAALPVSPVGTLRKRAVAGAAIGGGVGSAIGFAAVRCSAPIGSESSFRNHFATPSVRSDGVFVDKIKSLEVPRRLHADQFAALIDESRARPT